MSWLGRTGVIALVALSLASCNAAAPPAKDSSPDNPARAATTGAVSVDQLDGTTWRNTFTCDDMSETLAEAGLEKYAEQVVRQFGDCDGVLHTKLAFVDGAMATTGSDGGIYGPFPYQVVDPHTFVVEFHRDSYRVKGNILLFTDTQIIAALYPYDPKIIPREHAFDVALLETDSFQRVH